MASVTPRHEYVTMGGSKDRGIGARFDITVRRFLFHPESGRNIARSVWEDIAELEHESPFGLVSKHERL